MSDHYRRRDSERGVAFIILAVLVCIVLACVGALSWLLVHLLAG